VTDVLSTVIGADKKQFNICRIEPDKLKVQVDVKNEAAANVSDPDIGTTDGGNSISMYPF